MFFDQLCTFFFYKIPFELYCSSLSLQNRVDVFLKVFNLQHLPYHLSSHKNAKKTTFPHFSSFVWGFLRKTLNFTHFAFFSHTINFGRCQKSRTEKGLSEIFRPPIFIPFQKTFGWICPFFRLHIKVDCFMVSNTILSSKTPSAPYSHNILIKPRKSHISTRKFSTFSVSKAKKSTSQNSGWYNGVNLCQFIKYIATPYYHPLFFTFHQKNTHFSTFKTGVQKWCPKNGHSCFAQNMFFAFFEIWFVFLMV